MVAPRRSYTSEVRRQSARLTQDRILSAAEALFARDGYGVTTMAAVAREAGVTPQTVYTAVGGKAALLKRLYDVRLAGDAEAVPMADRAEFAAVRDAADPRALVVAYAQVGLLLIDRVGHIARMVADGAAAGDPDLRAMRATTDQERRIGATAVARRLEDWGALRDGVTVERAADVIWSVNSVEVWTLLVHDSGWQPAAWAAWMADAVAGTLIRQA